MIQHKQTLIQQLDKAFADNKNKLSGSPLYKKTFLDILSPFVKREQKLQSDLKAHKEFIELSMSEGIVISQKDINDLNKASQKLTSASKNIDRVKAIIAEWSFLHQVKVEFKSPEALKVAQKQFKLPELSQEKINELESNLGNKKVDNKESIESPQSQDKNKENIGYIATFGYAAAQFAKSAIGYMMETPSRMLKFANSLAKSKEQDSGKDR